MSTLTLALFVSFVAAASCATIQVSNTGELSNALNSANPGDTIQLADGTYRGSWEPTRSGSPGNPITITGSRAATIQGDKYGFWLKANWWVLQGFKVSSSPKGIVLEGASNNVIDSVEVYNTVQEGIHLRYNSADNIIRNCYVHKTGQGSATDQGYGEGIYLGQAVSSFDFFICVC